MNKLILVGRFTKEPEVKTLDSGTVIATVNIAVRRDFKDKSLNEYQSDFFLCKAFSKTAEFISNYTNKGDMVSVEGKVQSKKWDQDGQTRYGNDFIIDRIQKLSSSKKKEPESEFGFIENENELQESSSVPF